MDERGREGGGGRKKARLMEDVMRGPSRRELNGTNS